MDVKTRYALVTGANKGIGFEICKQLAVIGITVILTSRNEEKGLEALEKLKGFAGDDTNNIIFHRLDVADPSTIPPLVDFVATKFGKLDILINNAGILGSKIDWEALKSLIVKPNWQEYTSCELYHTFEMAEECLQVNYYGMKKMVEAFIPLLQLSNSPRILNVSSGAGKLENLSNEWAKGVLNDVEKLTEERIDEVVIEFLKDCKDGKLKAKGWPNIMAAYTVSKAALNAYTRHVAKEFSGILVNCACPGFARTDINDNLGTISVEEGAENLVKVALLPDNAPSGVFFDRGNKMDSF